MHTYIHKNESKHSEMGPVRQNPIHRTVSLFIYVSIALCTIVAHNIAQNRPDNFPSYPPDNILTSTLAAFLFSSHRKGKGIERLIYIITPARTTGEDNSCTARLMID